MKAWVFAILFPWGALACGPAASHEIFDAGRAVETGGAGTGVGAGGAGPGGGGGGAGGASGASDASTDADEPEPMEGGRSALLGRACDADSDCMGLTCVKASDSTMGGGGPAHGYCTARCATAQDPSCVAVGGACVDFAREDGDPPATWCVETCKRGGDQPDVHKCHARKEVACTPVSVKDGVPSQDGYCLPTCNSDSECGARRCDPQLGVCVDDAITGNPTGSTCGLPSTEGEAGADAAPTSCAGVCLSVGASTHACAQRCAYQSPEACHLPEGPIDGGAGAYSACLFVSAGTGPGDEAHCGQLCDTVHDCLDQSDPGVFCDTSDGALRAFGHGFCNWATEIPADAGSD